MTPCAAIAWAALVQRFMTTCCSRLGSPSTTASSSGRRRRRRPSAAARRAGGRRSPRAAGACGTGRCRCSVRRLKARIRSTMSRARSPAFLTSCTYRHARLFATQPAERHLGIAENGAEDVVEVVGDAAGQRAERLHALGMRATAIRGSACSRSACSRPSALAKISPTVRSSAMSSSAQRFSPATASKPSRPTRFPACHSGTQSQERMPRSVSRRFLLAWRQRRNRGDVDAAMTLIARSSRSSRWPARRPASPRAHRFLRDDQLWVPASIASSARCRTT